MKNTMSYSQFAEYIDATGLIHDLIDTVQEKDYSALLRGMRELASNENVVLVHEEDFDYKDFFDAVYNEFGL